MNEDGVFSARDDDRMTFSSTGYPDAKGAKVVIVSGYGKESFKAIRLPEKGAINFRQFLLTTISKEASEIEVWEVGSLLVSGITPIENWLPYDTASDITSGPVQDQGTDRTIPFDIDGNTNTMRTDYPKEPVKFVQARHIRRWRIPFTLAATK
jgi:hypothetical protein